MTDLVPSQRARELLRGAFDTHIHVAPDVVERKIDDVTLAHRFAELGLAGFILKSHYCSTAERAAVVRGVVPEVTALGAITLNAAVGGMNPLAVEIAAREGARTVWFPTVDAENEHREHAALPEGVVPPAWAKLQTELREQGVAVDPVPVVDADGRVLPETRVVLAAIARHGMLLATGHLDAAEIVAVVEAAFEEGVRDVVVTHPEFPTQQLSVETQRELAAKGALLERCFTTPHTGKVSWEDWLEHIREVGPEHSVLSTDLGQIQNPPVEDGLALLVDRLLAAGFDEEEVVTMGVVNSRRVAGVAA
jgi:Family of unknown function (DUF6282)